MVMHVVRQKYDLSEVGCWYRCPIGWIEASGKFGAVIQASSPTMKNSEVVRIRRSDHASVSSHMLSDPVPSGRAVIRNIEVFSSANDAVVPIPETERKYYEVPEAMEMSGCDNVFKVIPGVFEYSIRRIRILKKWKISIRIRIGKLEFDSREL
jgi:hypothetical protein